TARRHTTSAKTEARNRAGAYRSPTPRPNEDRCTRERAAITARGLNGLSGAAHGQTLDTQGGLPDTHRDALPVLAAHTHTRIEAHVVADH
ncbi:MAG: hypothetical protein RLZZ153_2489, partial [Pseudomonadota bacterium]